jgi:cytoskeletal protein CcmA (bactofilin family)
LDGDEREVMPGTVHQSDMSRAHTAGRSLALLLAAIVVLSAFTGVAAAETQAGGAVVVGPDETVDGLDAFGGSVLVQGTVRGDLNAFAGDVRIAEGARVTGDVSAFGGSVSIAGTVDGDVSGAAGTVTLGESAAIGGDVAVGGGTVVVAGSVAGNVEAGAETLVLEGTARVGGDVRYDAATFRDDGAAVEGSVVRDEGIGGPEPVVDPRVGGVLDAFFGVYAFLVNLVLGAILLLAFPLFSARVADRAVGDPLRSGGYGLLALVGVPVVLVAFAITVVGIPISVVGAIVFGVFAWVAAVYGRIAVGEWLVGYADVDNRWVALVVGLLVVAVAVRVPVLGGIVDFAVLVLGLGALALTLYRAYRGESGSEETGRAADVDAGTDEGARPA